MDKKHHKRITEFLSEGFGGEGISSLVSAVFVVVGANIFVVGANITTTEEIDTLTSLVGMHIGIFFMLSGFIYRKLSRIQKDITGRSYSLWLKTIIGALSAFYYSYAITFLLVI